VASTLFKKLQDSVDKGLISENLAAIIHSFYVSYAEAIEENGYALKDLEPILNQFLVLVIEQLQHPYSFEPFHERVTHPIDYYRFGLDLIRPLVVFSRSRLKGLDQVERMQASLKKGENVILFGNHQTEPDPQAISLLLEKTHPRFAEEMIFVAGHRVVTDPLAVPFSKGRNLLCIFSKRHIETPPELKQEKLLHNQKTMKIMAQLLSEGGKCIYVAPSGGRDRRNGKGAIKVAPFDPQSIEMFYLMAKQSGKTTHFHPLALATYDLLPPPSSVEKELGEKRHAKCTPIHLSFGAPIDMEKTPGSDSADKKQKRQLRAEYIWKLVADDYANLLKGS
jgi:glycerol-3-phosphate O-acyltransferase